MSVYPMNYGIHLKDVNGFKKTEPLMERIGELAVRYGLDLQRLIVLDNVDGDEFGTHGVNRFLFCAHISDLMISWEIVEHFPSESIFTEDDLPDPWIALELTFHIMHSDDHELGYYDDVASVGFNACNGVWHCHGIGSTADDGSEEKLDHLFRINRFCGFIHESEAELIDGHSAAGHQLAWRAIERIFRLFTAELEGFGGEPYGFVLSDGKVQSPDGSFKILLQEIVDQARKSHPEVPQVAFNSPESKAWDPDADCLLSDGSIQSGFLSDQEVDDLLLGLEMASSVGSFVERLLRQLAQGAEFKSSLTTRGQLQTMVDSLEPEQVDLGLDSVSEAGPAFAKAVVKTMFGPFLGKGLEFVANGLKFRLYQKEKDQLGCERVF